MAAILDLQLFPARHSPVASTSSSSSTQLSVQAENSLNQQSLSNFENSNSTCSDGIENERLANTEVNVDADGIVKTGDTKLAPPSASEGSKDSL